jgi:hypothetical protein
MATLTAYLLLATIAGCLLLPGALLMSAWAPRRLTPLQLLICVLPVGLVFFAVLGLVSALVASLGGTSWRLAGMCAYVGLLLPAAMNLDPEWPRPALRGTGEHACLARVAWLTFALVIMVCFTLAIQNVSDPWEMQFFRDISSTKTFGTYSTHDNYFQFVNGAAIADGEPFSKYYGEGRLVYPVTSREMLPGLTYAGLRFVLRAAGSGVERSFLPYLQFGLIQNAGLVLGLAALIASCGLGARVFGLVALTFWSSPYALMNTYFTWFKFAGAGLALLAVAALLAERQPTTRHYALAGTLFGLSTNMHSSSALAVPFLAWAVLRRMPWDQWRCMLELRNWVVAVSCFMVMLAPWTIVKALQFAPDKILFRQHYVNDIGANHDSIWKLAHLLFTQWTPEQHLAHRIGNVITALRLPEWLEVARASGENALVLWMQFRFTYVGFVLAPIALAALWVGWRRHVSSPALGNLGICSLVGIGVLLLAHFSTFYADMTANLPASLIVVSYLWLVFVATNGAEWRGLAVALVCFSVLEWGAAGAMLVRQVGQKQFAQSRTVMSELAMFSYLH